MPRVRDRTRRPRRRRRSLGIRPGITSYGMAFPATRLRRLRQTGVLRSLVRETDLAVSQLVYPMFVVASGPRGSPIAELQGIDPLSIDGAVEEAGIAQQLGIPAVLLFGLPAAKDEVGS